VSRRKHHGHPWLDDEIPPAPPEAATVDDYGPLFAPVVPAARTADPSTSNEGIWDVLPRAGSQQAKLLRAFAAHPMGLTADEAAVIAHLEHVGHWKRTAELKRHGLVTYTGQQRKARSGSYQEVLSITDKGRAAVPLPETV